MSDVIELVLEDDSLEISIEDGIEVVFTEDGLEVVTVDENVELLVDDQTIELLTDTEPGIPGGGATGQVLAKKSDLHFDAEWITISTKITVSATAPENPRVGDLWVDTN